MSMVDPCIGCPHKKEFQFSDRFGRLFELPEEVQNELEARKKRIKELEACIHGEVIHTPPPEGEAPVDQVTPKPKGWPTPRADEKKVADLYSVLAQAKPYVQKSPTEPEAGAKKKLVEEIEAALRTAATHDLVDRARHLELQGAEAELKHMARFFHAAPEVEKKWIDWCEWERAIKHQQEREERLRMTGRHLGDGIAEK
jgi:hypothetical protein